MALATYVYVLFGAVAGAIIGHLVPPGYLFWFVVGAGTGFLAERYFSRK